VLFGLDLALPGIRTENAVIIVEGYFDHLALYRAGIRNAVATCGTALTATHAVLIKRHAERAYLLFDSDGAGRKATIRSMELFLEQRLPAYVISLPGGDDPDSFLSSNPVEQFAERKRSARPAFEFFVRSLLAERPPDSVDNKVRVIDEIIPRYRKIADPVERDLYEKEVCRLLGITVHAFRKRLGGMSLTARDSLDQQQNRPTSGDPTQETLLSLLLDHPEAREEAVRCGLASLFSDDYLAVAQHLIAAEAENGSVRAADNLAESLETGEQRSLLSRIQVSDMRVAENEWRSVYDQCARSREKKQVSSIKGIAARLAALDSSSDEYRQLLEQADSLRSRKSKL